MKITNYGLIRKKWFENFFECHGIQKVARNFASDSLEMLLFENLLSSFFGNGNINNRYVLMGGLDYGLYEDKFYNSAVRLLNILNEKSQKTDFKVSYNNHIMYLMNK